MNNLFQENKRSFLLLLSLLFLLLIVLFAFFYQPLKQDLRTQENRVKMLENEKKVLEMEINNVEDVSATELDVDEYLIEQKLPLDPKMEQLILTIQELELISDSRFDNISFTYGDNAPQREMTEEDTAEIDTNETNEELTENDIVIFEEIPENLQVITVSFTVSSPDYQHFQQLLQLIENQERYMTITSLDLQKPAERELLTMEESEVITAKLDLTTFYYLN